MDKPEPGRGAKYVECVHSDPSARTLVSVHRTAAGTVSYLRCSCGAWMVLRDGEVLAVVAPPAPRAALPIGT
jgi:hypothetical protein